MKLLNKNSDLSFLNSQFNDGEFNLFVSDDPLCYMSCFVCCFKNKNAVIESWETLQNLISAYYQPHTELARWNVYIVFICIEKLAEWDKYLIENDTYTARKVIIDNIEKLPHLNQIEQILNNYLLGADLKMQNKKDQTHPKLASNLDKLMDLIPLESTNEAKIKRADVINKLIKVMGEK